MLSLNTVGAGSTLDTLLKRRVPVRVKHWGAAEKLAHEYTSFATKQPVMLDQGIRKQIRQTWRMLRDIAASLIRDTLFNEDEGAAWDRILQQILARIHESKTTTERFVVALHAIVAYRVTMMMALDIDPDKEDFGVTNGTTTAEESVGIRANTAPPVRDP
jgi:hypothetical protein